MLVYDRCGNHPRKSQEAVFLHKFQKPNSRQKWQQPGQMKYQCSRGTGQYNETRWVVAIHNNYTIQKLPRLHHPQSLGEACEARWKIEGPPYACASHFPSDARVQKKIDALKGCAALDSASREAEDGRSLLEVPNLHCFLRGRREKYRCVSLRSLIYYY